MFLKLVSFSNKICIVGSKIRFKAIHPLQYHENVHFLLPPLILSLYTGCRLSQILSKCIASFFLKKSAKMLRIGVLFISQALPYSFCACVRNTPKIVTFIIGNMKLVSFSLFLDAFPPRPKMPFGQRHVAINIYNICKGHFGSKGGEHLKQTERHQFHLSNDKRHTFRCISYACAEGIR